MHSQTRKELGLSEIKILEEGEEDGRFESEGSERGVFSTGHAKGDDRTEV
jgi:hypothetical protein